MINYDTQYSERAFDKKGRKFEHDAISWVVIFQDQDKTFFKTVKCDYAGVKHMAKGIVRHPEHVLQNRIGYL